MTVERIDQKAERHLLLEPDRTAAQHETAALGRLARGLVEEARLADPSLAGYGNAPTRSLRESVERPPYQLPLALPANEHGDRLSPSIPLYIHPRARPGPCPARYSMDAASTSASTACGGEGSYL